MLRARTSFIFKGESMYSGPADVKQVVKARQPDSSKRDFGCLLVVGGSDIYSGAPALAGMAALRTGSGLVVIAAPNSVASTIRAYSPNLIVHPLRGAVVSRRDIDKLAKLLATSDAMVLGPGIGSNTATRDAVPLIVKMAARMRKPILIDADAITALRGKRRLLRDATTVITPHRGEFRAISGIHVPRELRRRMRICRKFALDYSCTLVLKGHNTIVSDGHHVKINRTGNAGMAVGGTGDVLSGIVGAFLAQGSDHFFAAVAGVYVHGLAGDFVRKQKGFHMVASDLIDALPNVMRPYDRND
jgi:ADP-dependent NAD(P)H-hydrate dehydratase / NAD(P)H-hydrate epimerase